MTIADLYTSVAKLGFEDSLEDDEAFFRAANRAILQINAIRPMRAVHEVNHRPLPNAIGSRGWSVVDVYKEEIFEAESARSFYFEADGNGQYAVEAFSGGDWTTVKEGEFSFVGFGAVRGLIANDGGEPIDLRVRLRIFSDYACSVRNVALYNQLLGPGEENIPAFNKFIRYDISARVGDFLALADLPAEVTSGDRMSGGYAIEDGRVLVLPYESRGVYKITYNRRPGALVWENDPAGDNTHIDLDEDLCALMPLLVASYLCLDGEEAKAAHYLTLYQAEAVNIERRTRRFEPSEYKNVTGW